MYYQLESDKISPFRDEEPKIQAWDSLQYEEFQQCNLLKQLYKQISKKTTKQHSKPINQSQSKLSRPLTTRHVYSSGSSKYTKNPQRSGPLREKNFENVKRQMKDPAEMLEQLQKKYSSNQTKRKQSERTLINMKKQSLMFNSNQQLRPKNFAQNIKNFHEMEKKVRKQNFKKDEEIKLCITVKKSKENKYNLKLKEGQPKSAPLKIKYEPLSTRNKQKRKIFYEGDLFSDVHLSKNDKIFHAFRKI